MINKRIVDIFKNGSRTYFYSSIFFPADVRKEVFTFYAYVRKADDFVDTIPQQKDSFFKFKEQTIQAINGKPSQDLVIDSFVALAKKYDLEKLIANDFLQAMEADLYKSQYQTIQETEKYMYGSAEVIGLTMARILKLQPEAAPYAQSLGKAMQFANFIRDIQEDNHLQRQYLPLEDLQQFGLTSLKQDYVEKNLTQFERFINFEVKRYNQWQSFAEQGFKYIPRRYLIPIKTASDMYKWTMQTIQKRPSIIYQKKVKPSVQRITATIALNSISL